MNEKTVDQQTALFEEHKRLGAKIIPFSGWSMPVQYKTIMDEHKHTRQHVGIFDIGHMGEFRLCGEKSSQTLDRLVTSKPSSIAIGKCRYGLILNEKGGVIDDTIVYRMAEHEFMLVVNGATRHKDLSHIKSNLSAGDELVDISDETGKIDVQGPESFKVVKEVLGEDMSSLKYFSHCKKGSLIISRTGYTGELGLELYASQTEIVELWKKFIEHDLVMPIGLGARDTLRLESGYSLYGHELDEETPAIYCGVDRFIDWENEFIGKEALLKFKEKPEQVFVAFKSEGKSAPRAEEALLDGEDVIGKVTSGSLSPSLGYAIGIGRIGADKADLKKLQVDKGRRKLDIEICDLPFYIGTARKKIIL